MLVVLMLAADAIHEVTSIEWDINQAMWGSHSGSGQY